ncbi:MAG: hypothetical protein HUU15_03635 [Candidatus Brocadiae bacterium]|nr:hypothetical protein [Candidatus Brocadiia bacterium]
MRLLLLIVPLLLLPGCFRERFEPGRGGALEFKLSNGFWADEFSPSTPLVEAGETQLVARSRAHSQVLHAVAQDPAVVRVLEAVVAAAKTEDGAVWRWLVRGVAPGRTVVEIRDGETVVDSVEVTVAPAAALDWKVYDPDRESRRSGDTLRLLPGENLEVDVLYTDAAGDRLAGVRACFVALENTTLMQEPDPETPHACTAEVLYVGARGPIRFTGRAFGSTDVVLSTPDGKVRRTLRVKVGGP